MSETNSRLKNIFYHLLKSCLYSYIKINSTSSYEIHCVIKNSRENDLE